MTQNNACKLNSVIPEVFKKHYLSSFPRKNKGLIKKVGGYL